MGRGHGDDPGKGRALRRTKALSVPSRVEILDVLDRSPSAMTASQVAAECGLHASTVQQHLTVLVEAGLVVSESLAPTGRGRPRLGYRAVTEQDSYRELSSLLVGGIPDPEVALEIGRRHGGRLAMDPSGPAETIRQEAERMGFAPSMESKSDGTTEIVLHVCPIAGVAEGNERVVCAVHRGIAEGALSRDGTASLLQFVAHDPTVAGCRLVIGAAAGHGS